LGLSEDNFLISLKHFPSTRFKHYGIQRLVRVTDTEGNVTTFTYDMGDRRTEVNHPASGITSFTYDALGNVLTKQTAKTLQRKASSSPTITTISV
jgi:YD repeat-containing protein